MTLYLIAHAVNAVSHETVEIELEVASPSPDGNWYTNDGMRVTPFWSVVIDESEVPTMPEGWIEHLHELARKSAVGRSPLVDIRSMLSLPPKATIRRRL